MAGVIDRDLGFNRIMRDLERLNGTEVVAGMLRDSGKAKNGASYVDIAAWNEYGTGHIPSRPFIRISADTNKQAWSRPLTQGAWIEICGHRQEVGWTKLPPNAGGVY